MQLGRLTEEAEDKNPRSHSFLLVDAADDAHIDT